MTKVMLVRRLKKTLANSWESKDGIMPLKTKRIVNVNPNHARLNSDSDTTG